MRSLRRIPHLLALLLALGPGVVPGVAAVADAALIAPARGDRVGAHVEQLGGTACQRVHTDACDLCRLLSLHARPAPAAPALAVPATRATRVSAELELRPATAAAGLALPRGPPIA